MTGLYSVDKIIKKGIGAALQTESDDQETELNRISSVIRGKMNLSMDIEFRFVRRRPWSSIVEFTVNGIFYLAKIEHLSSVLYFAFLECLSDLNTSIVVKPITVIEDEGITIFEVRNIRTLREEIRKGGQPLDELNAILFEYGELQKSFNYRRAVSQKLSQFFRVSTGSLEEAVLLGAKSAEDILKTRDGYFTDQLLDVLRASEVLGLPSTLVHTDLHDGNVFYQDGRWRIGDWSELLVGPIGSDLILFIHAMIIAHPDKDALATALSALSRYMDGVGDMLDQKQRRVALEFGYKVLPALQLHGFRRSMSSAGVSNFDPTPEQLFWAEALLRSLNGEQAGQNEFLQEIYAQLDRKVWVN